AYQPAAADTGLVIGNIDKRYEIKVKRSKSTHENMSMGFVGNMDYYVSSLWIFFITFKLHFDDVDSISNIDVDRHLELGKVLLTKGQFADALTHFHAAIESDPTNYISYYRRATAFLALAKSKSALPDLNKVVELKPDFLSARIQRGMVYVKQGKLDEAHIDFEQVLARDPGNPDALHYYNLIGPLQRDIEVAYLLMQDRDYYRAIEVLSKTLELCPWDAKLHEMRADCFIEIGDISKAIHDIKPTTKLRNDNTDAYFKLSKLHYQLGESDDSLQEVRECLKLDPDHKECFNFYKKVKKIVGQIKSIYEFMNEKEYDRCLDKVQQMLKTEKELPTYVIKAKAFQCQCHLRANQISEAIRVCSETLAMEESAPVLCDRADAYIANDQFSEAIRDFERAENIDPDLSRAREGKQKAEKSFKQSKKRDYYKILGVKRTDNKKTILKAYRKMAQKWHPDNFQDAAEKKKAENKFIDIASAKEVLTDPEKREKFDNGEDPLDPESQSGQGFNPFGQGFHSFGGGGNGGGFQFKFHF
uniref:J domain-containing protein n=1 Tax=Strigamia maritima TaxID=126957 RepID=T1IWF6_STRMM